MFKMSCNASEMTIKQAASGNAGRIRRRVLGSCVVRRICS